MLLSTLISLATAGAVLARNVWPIPIPSSLLPESNDQRPFGTNLFRPHNVRLIQTVEGRYQWTGDIEGLLRNGVKLMDVTLL
jgi:hypothetical protein